MNARLLLGFVLGTFGCVSANAQQRKCDMQVTLVSPSENAVISPFAQYNLTVRVQNNGPNDLLLGDTLWYNIPTIPLISYAIYILPQAIGVGQSRDITLATLVNINENTEDEDISFYATVTSSPDTNASFRDMILNNNRDANNITYKPCGTNGGTDIHDINGAQIDVQTYPNPTTNSVNIKGEGITFRQIVVVDLSGRVIFNRHFFNDSNEAVIDLSSLNKGMYFLKIETDKGIATKKVIKQ